MKRYMTWTMGSLLFVLGLPPGCKGKVSMSRPTAQAQSCQDSSNCPAGQECQNNICVGQGCQATCSPGEKSCQSDIVVACYFDSNDCPRWYPQWRCPSDQICMDGMCLPPGCQPNCTLGDKSCQGDQVMVCRQDETGCPTLVADKTCSDDEYCQDGSCKPKAQCEDECTLGNTGCTDAGVPATCQLADSGCLQLVPATPCGEHQVCDNGQCTCADTCQAGQTQCGPGGGQQTCMGPDADGCTYWGEEETCGVHQACTNGACQCTGGCNPGTTQCGPNGGEQTCVTDEDGCTYMSDEESCYADMECAVSEGKCMPHTDPSCYSVNECLYYGQKKCMDTEYYGTCRYGDDGCLHWDCST